jgi:hypothetical protein
MNRVGLDRCLAGCGARLGVGGWEHRNTTNGRQDKSAASGWAQVVGWVGLFDCHGHATDSGPRQFANDFNAKTDIAHHFEEGPSDAQS